MSKAEPLGEEKKCLECGDKLYGRSDQKFCSDACRNAYNNRLRSEENKMMRDVNGILKRNRKILLELNPKGKTKVSREKMLKAGFNFDYFTNELITKAGARYRFCYEQGYLGLDEDYYMLVVRS